mmetsp:Transcript_13353/g.30452  ORF Transcript_13353/g.30452 Transcript_13353/m.30452 type:complete len:670 (-) Transcript_13353:192-2201(-)
MPPKADEGGGRGGKGKKGAGKSTSSSGKSASAGKTAAATPADDDAGRGHAAAKELQDLDDGSIQQESNIEILRAQRAAARRGKKVEFDSVREDQGIDEDDPLIKVDDGIRLEPFNMRREMREGHFDEAGCYILNREEEKKVMDAWLDTVDQAEKTAAFQRLERLEKAKELAESRLAALSKNLGKDEGEADEDDDDDADKDKAEAKDGKETADGAKEAAAKEKEEAVEEEPNEDVVAVLETLITELFPLETPTEALARLRRGALGQTTNVALPLQRLRRQRQQQRKVEGAAAQAGAADQAAAKRDAKRRFSEFGYDEVTAEDEQRQKSQKKLQGATFLQSDGAAAEEEKKVEAPNQSDTAGTEAPGETDADMKSASVDASAVAAAAEKAAEAEKAAAEAAAAERAESRLTRKTLHVNADAKDGSEVQAVLAAMAEDPRDMREGQDKQAAVVPEARRRSPSPLPSRANESRKRARHVDSATAERTGKIEHLTSLCDRLLERGVLVYDSTREQLAIEVRQRRGDMEDKDGKGEEKPKEGHAAEPTKGDAGNASAAIANTQLVYTNQRVKSAKAVDKSNASIADILLNASSEGDVGEDLGAQHQSAGLYWQYRWLANKESVYGPFDSLTMRGWAMQGCFDEERPAEIRQCDKDNKGTEECWHSWEKIDFSLYM